MPETYHSSKPRLSIFCIKLLFLMTTVKKKKHTEYTYSGTPLNGHPSGADTCDTTDNLQSPNCLTSESEHPVNSVQWTNFLTPIALFYLIKNTPFIADIPVDILVLWCPFRSVSSVLYLRFEMPRSLEVVEMHGISKQIYFAPVT